MTTQTRSLRLTLACSVVLLISCIGQQASAGVMSSISRADFALTPEAFNTTNFTHNDIVSSSRLMTLQNGVGIGHPPTGTHAYRNWTGSILPGEVYVMNGDENFNVLFSSPQTAFAFDYEDDRIDSVFTLEFFDGASSLGTATFTSTSPFNTSKFIGFYSDSPFTRITVREDDGNRNTNEYFQFYSARIVPEPTSLTVFLLGAVLAACPRRRTRRITVG